jgi:hypothetical protein
MPISWNPTSWIDSLIEKRMHLAGQAMVAKAKALVAVDSGTLQESIGYRYDPATKTLTLFAGTHYALYQEFGTSLMKPHPYLRPALNVAGPAFLTGALGGVTTQIALGTSLGPDYVPRKIQPHIRPHIAAANALNNVGAASRAKLVALHMDRKNKQVHVNVGLEQKSKVRISSLSKLNRLRGAWN